MRLALLILALSAASAHASGTTLAVPGVDGATLAGDGVRYAVVGAGQGAALVFDDRSPAEGFRTVTFDPVCRFAGVVGGGRLGLACTDSGSPYAIAGDGTAFADLATGAVTRVAVPLLDSNFVVGIGRRWVEIARAEYHTSGDVVFSDTATGALRYGGLTRRSAPDLDAADPVAPLCAPVHRARPKKTRTTRVGRWVVFEEEDLRLLAWRCGQPEPIVIARTAYGFSAGGGTVTWSNASPRIQTYRLADGARASVPGVDTEGFQVQTRHYLFATHGPNGQATVTVYPRPAFRATSPRSRATEPRHRPDTPTTKYAATRR